ncbi:unannotated protein [freshwater metagenome]|uniref:Unannotated protein n=1 Tax=freshwater metagenome TaxID=449393 RepID=A0A6J7N6X8_9ZZZZ
MKAYVQVFNVTPSTDVVIVAVPARPSGNTKNSDIAPRVAVTVDPAAATVATAPRVVPAEVTSTAPAPEIVTLTALELAASRAVTVSVDAY